MAHIWLTGNRDIDSATAEIAVALRNACPVLCGDQDHYEQAAALRDQIMKGTRALMVTDAVKACDESAETARLYEDLDDSNLRDHNDGSDRAHQQHNDASADYEPGWFRAFMEDGCKDEPVDLRSADQLGEDQVS